MKKLLALVLALVMTLSLATVSTNAAFDDANNIEYTEAVDVMNAIGVLEGDGTGNFNPKGILNREQAAKILSTLLLGKSVAGKLTVDSVKFADVKATDWAAPFIAYCAANGIVVGDGTNFYPTTKLTGHAFAKMLLVAIGAEGNYTGADWAINVAVDVQKYGLDAGLSSLVLSNELTREEAAQMALNAALYTKAGKTYLVDGKYSFDNMTDALLYAAILNANVEIVSGKDTLLNTVFGVSKVDGIDSFGRPAVKYLNAKGKTLVLIADEADFTYAGADFKANLFNKGKALDGYTVDEDTVVLYNGAAIDKFTYAKLPYQVLGATVELFVNNSKHIDKIIVTEGYFTEVTTKNTSKKTGVTTMTLTVYEAGYYLANGEYAKITVNSEADEDLYEAIADLAKGDVFMGYYAPNWENTKALITFDTDVDVLEGKVTAKNADSKYNGYVKVDGVSYTFANEYSQAPVALRTNNEGTFYLYNNYIVHFDVATTATTINDVFYLAKTWNLAGGVNEYGETVGKTHYAQIVNLDGTVETIVVDEASEALPVGLYTAKFDSANDVNVLKAWAGDSTYSIAKIATDTEIKAASVKAADGKTVVRFDSNTLNIVTNGKSGSGLKVTTSNGILKAKTAATATVIGTKNGANLTAAYVIVPGSASIAVAGTMVYVDKYSAGDEVVAGDKSIDCIEYTVYGLDGETEILYVAADATVTLGWNTYLTKDGVATLTAYTTELPAADKTGVVAGDIVAGDLYGYLLTIAGVVDIDIENATVIDLTGIGCETADDIIELLDSEYTVTVNMYVKDGAAVIVMTNAK